VCKEETAEQVDPELQTLGAYITNLIDKANPVGRGITKRKAKKSGDIQRRDPDIVGQFRVRVDDPDFDAMFVSMAIF
jgi:hypothetical protein